MAAELSERMSDITVDLWDYLKSSPKPVVLYGMGDGADKIASVLDEKGIPLAGIFCSDGFVRPKIFRSFPLKSYRELKEELGDFIALLAFGTRLEEVIGKVCAIAGETELYVPDVPVFGTGLFDLAYYKAHEGELSAVYDRLCDEKSKDVFINALKFRLTGKLTYLFAAESTADESFETILKPFAGCHYTDVGAYNGDTIADFYARTGKGTRFAAFEPDRRNFRKLRERVVSLGIEEDCELRNLAAWDKAETLSFYARSGRNSAATAANPMHKAVLLEADRIDAHVKQTDYIKIDAEGSDEKVLRGASRLITEWAPSLIVAAYHRVDDYTVIPATVFSIRDNYDLYFRHFRYLPLWDTNFYFIRHEK